jgi:hypothetical protein
LWTRMDTILQPTTPNVSEVVTTDGATLAALEKRPEGFVIVPSMGTLLAEDQTALTAEVRLWPCFSEQQRCADIGVAPPLAIALGNERDLVASPRL